MTSNVPLTGASPAAGQSPVPAASRFKAALVQMRSGRDVAANIATACEMIEKAAKGGAHYVQTPEVTTLMELDRERLFAAIGPEAGNPALERFKAVALTHGIWLHIGSMGVRVGDKIANRSYVIGPDGAIVARYDKIHMFDVQLANGETYRESANYVAGDQAVVAGLPWGGLGLTICYDLRFPALHQSLVHGGAKFLAVPAAFTRPTGEAHWHTLLRARAIETQCFVFAAAQGGMHEHGRETYGHSLIISPWGSILAEAGIEPAVISADIDLAELEAVRSRIPCLQHGRPYTLHHARAVANPGS